MDHPVLPELGDLYELIRGSLTTWGEFGSTEEELLGFLLLVQLERSRVGRGLSPLELRKATNNVLLAAIEELSIQDGKEASILRSRFIDGEITRQVANKMYASTDQVNRWQRSAIENLARIILSREQTLRKERQQEMEEMLPSPPYDRLHGFDTLVSDTVDQLQKPGGPWTLVIVGIGGIGKTSLADAAARKAAQTMQFKRIVWIRAGARELDGDKLSPTEVSKQVLDATARELWPQAPGVSEKEQRNRVRRALKREPHLIIIDNLESEEDTAGIVEMFHDFTNPSKVVATSRGRPAVTAEAYFIHVEELPISDAGRLVRQQAESIGLTELASAPRDDIQAIYDVAGGNPLALKLIVSLAAVLPFDQILADLAKSRPGPIEDLYRFIYLESWRSLSDNGQTLLQAMPLVSEVGALPEQMVAISGLDQGRFWASVEELVSRSLLEIRGTMHERRYGIHRLTESFLRTEIIHWPED